MLRGNRLYHVDPGRGQCGVDNDAFARFLRPDEELRATVLLSDKRRDVRLETSSAKTHDDDSDDEARECTIGVINNTRYRRDDKKNMAKESDTD
jgi:hypothetical protein